MQNIGARLGSSHVSYNREDDMRAQRHLSSRYLMDEFYGA